MHTELSTSREDYLKAIIEAESEGHTVLPTLLSHWLEVSPPAVTKAIRRLREDGLVEDSQGALQLTPEGREIAHRTAFRHYLVERMLAEIFGMEWHQIHAEAERLEHVISPEFERRLIEKLGEEARCPHGNYVLPEPPSALRERGLCALSELVPTTACVVESLYERDTELLAYLHQLGIGPRCELTVLARNYDRTLLLELRCGKQVTLGLTAAERVLVRSTTAFSDKGRQLT